MPESPISPAVDPGRRSEPPGTGTSRRALIVCLYVVLAYLAAVLLGLLLRWELHRWGWVLARWQFSALRGALCYHAGLGAVVGGLILWVRLRSRVLPWQRHVVAVSVFPLLLVSADLVASIGFRSITPKTAMLMPHPTRYWTLRPGWVRTDGAVSYRINEHGLRGPLIPYEKQAEEHRLLFLGDSIAFGLGVNDADGFVRRIETMGGKLRTESELTVVNASVTGYSPWQEADLLEAHGFRYDPDVVLQVFCLNDIGQKFRLDKFGGRTKHLAPPEPSVVEWSGLFRMSRSLGFRWFGPTRDELKLRETEYAPNAIVEDFDAPHIQEALRVTEANLLRLVSLARDSGRPIAIVCFPTGRQIDMPAGSWSRPQDWLSAFCRQHGVPLLDLASGYRRYAEVNALTGTHLFPDNIHPNKLAHRLAADIIYDFLLEREWLGRRP